MIENFRRAANDCGSQQDPNSRGEGSISDGEEWMRLFGLFANVFCVNAYLRYMLVLHLSVRVVSIFSLSAVKLIRLVEIPIPYFKFLIRLVTSSSDFDHLHWAKVWSMYDNIGSTTLAFLFSAFTKYLIVGVLCVRMCDNMHNMQGRSFRESS